MGHLGEGTRRAAGRRNDLMVQEESSRREAEAYFSAYVRGRGSRGGRARVRRGGSWREDLMPKNF